MSLIFGAGQALSGNELVLTVALWLIFALLGYRISWRHQALRGVTPWRFPSFVWAVICFTFGPIGLVVELFAEVTTKPRLPSSLGRLSIRDASARLGLRSQQQTSPLSATREAGTGAQADIGVRAQTPPPQEALQPVVQPVPLGPPPPLDAAGKTAAFGWYADPLAHHELRYFDGRGWSDFVKDGGVRSSDPLQP
jgi:hypothetical protein